MYITTTVTLSRLCLERGAFLVTMKLRAVVDGSVFPPCPDWQCTRRWLTGGQWEGQCAVPWNECCIGLWLVSTPTSFFWFSLGIKCLKPEFELGVPGNWVYGRTLTAVSWRDASGWGKCLLYSCFCASRLTRVLVYGWSSRPLKSKQREKPFTPHPPAFGLVRVTKRLVW